MFSAILLPMAVRADDVCRYRADRAAEVSTEGIRRVVVEVGAGSLDIRGEPRRQRMQASGEACASNEQVLERLQIRVQRRGATLVISTLPPASLLDPSSWFDGGEDGRLDILIKVPKGIAFDVEDGSGDAHISNVGALTVTDGSGSLRIEDIEGSLELVDGSDDVTIARVRGSLRMKDGSGEVGIEQITGEVTIINDGSGGLAIRDVQDDVTVVNDGSEDIRIERISGSVNIGNDGSGDIYVSRVKRDVVVDHDGAGAIVVQDIDGNLSVGEDGSGGIRHERIGGILSLPDNDS
jgi:hypothetical protein